MDKRGGLVKKLFNHIVGELIAEEKIKGGLYAPKATREERFEKLKVVQGDEDINEGDIVLIPYGKGTLVPIEGKEYLFINKREIISIL